jgi:hypothetical protein
MVEQQLALFDYATLDIETRTIVKQRTTEIKSLMKRAAQDIIEIGLKLIEVGGLLEHGKFLGWLTLEFPGFGKSTAYNCMNVAKKFPTVGNLEIGAKALYLLAAPSTPDFAREEAILRADSGETITYSTAKDIVEKHKEYEQEFKIQNFGNWVNDHNPPYEVEDLPDPTPEPSPLQSQSMGLLTKS